MHAANYADDPDGIGLELASETPSDLRASWEGEPGFEPGERGHRWGGRDPRYLAWLASCAPDGDSRPGLPPGTIVGQMHLRVADTGASLAFYRDVIGFTANKAGTPGARFDVSAGGAFRHRLACDTWESAGRPQRPAEASGMRHFTLQLRWRVRIPRPQPDSGTRASEVPADRAGWSKRPRHRCSGRTGPVLGSAQIPRATLSLPQRHCHETTAE